MSLSVINLDTTVSNTTIVHDLCMDAQEEAANNSARRTMNNKTNINKDFTGLSRDFPGTVPGLSRHFPEISLQRN